MREGDAAGIPEDLSGLVGDGYLTGLLQSVRLIAFDLPSEPGVGAAAQGTMHAVNGNVGKFHIVFLSFSLEFPCGSCYNFIAKDIGFLEISC